MLYEDYESFIANCLFQIVPGKHYSVDVEISPGDTHATVEIFNCERFTRFFGEDQLLTEYFQNGIKYDNKKELEEDRIEIRDSTINALEEKLAQKPYPLRIIRENDGYFGVRKKIE